MTKVKLTKTALREQQNKLSQLKRYLPTLQLKKAMLQLEVNNTEVEIEKETKKHSDARAKVSEFSTLLAEKIECNVSDYAKVQHVEKRYENIAGVEIPLFHSILFYPANYSLFDTPIWTDAATEQVRNLVKLREVINILEEKKRALEKELREVSIRVNLFEKVLIPRSQSNIKKIQIFLGDQQLAAVSQAKVAKTKILAKQA